MLLLLIVILMKSVLLSQSTRMRFLLMKILNLSMKILNLSMKIYLNRFLMRISDH